MLKIQPKLECEACSSAPDACNKCSRLASQHPFNDCVIMPDKVVKALVKVGSLALCVECSIKEKNVIQAPKQSISINGHSNIPEHKDTLQGRIETIVEKTVDKSVDRWQDIYNTERKAWVVSNFESQAAMRSSLLEFLVTMENMQFEAKTKARAAYDSARELDATLSKSERDALINDPNFKPAENSEFKKRKIQTTRQSKEDKARAALEALGLSAEEIRQAMKGA